MFVRTETTIGFDPVKDFELMQNFEAENDMVVWHKIESTMYTMFVKTDIQHYNVREEVKS